MVHGALIRQIFDVNVALRLERRSTKDHSIRNFAKNRAKCHVAGKEWVEIDNA